MLIGSINRILALRLPRLIYALWQISLALSKASWIRTGISGFGISALLLLTFWRWLSIALKVDTINVSWSFMGDRKINEGETHVLVFNTAMSLPLSRALVMNSMQWSVSNDRCSNATFFSFRVFCFVSQISFNLFTKCFPRVVTASVNLQVRQHYATFVMMIIHFGKTPV